MPTIALGGADAGARLDRFLVDALGVSRSQARRLLASGAVSLEGRTLGYGDKGLSLPSRGVLEVAPFRLPGEQRAQAASALDELASGPGWLAVDKPAGRPVHPLDERETDTVLNAVIACHPEIHGVGEGGLRSGVLHRLDTDTSGVLLLGTEDSQWTRLREAFRRHRVEKTYRAILAGRYQGPEEMKLDLAVARHRPAKVRVVDEARPRVSRAYPIRQQVRVLELLREATLVEVRIETGFLHQIRVTLAHVGHAVVGDALYGDAPALAFGAPRQMLHAAHIGYEEISAESPDPKDFTAVLESAR
ncbi:MAG: RluA family pseudouridine synthase [Myxococcota bacterium]|nr:RluA family pseudouridine synthase [Myxococcota bacterium]